MAGGQFGEMDRWLAPLKDRAPDAELWGKAWSDMAGQQEDEAALDLKEGYRRSAGARYLPSCRVPFQWRKAGPPGARKKRQLSSRDEFLHKSHRADAAASGTHRG